MTDLAAGVKLYCSIFCAIQFLLQILDYPKMDGPSGHEDQISLDVYVIFLNSLKRDNGEKK